MAVSTWSCVKEKLKFRGDTAQLTSLTDVVCLGPWKGWISRALA